LDADDLLQHEGFAKVMHSVRSTLIAAFTTGHLKSYDVAPDMHGACATVLKDLGKEVTKAHTEIKAVQARIIKRTSTPQAAKTKVTEALKELGNDLSCLLELGKPSFDAARGAEIAEGLRHAKLIVPNLMLGRHYRQEVLDLAQIHKLGALTQLMAVAADGADRELCSTKRLGCEEAVARRMNMGVVETRLGLATGALKDAKGEADQAIVQKLSDPLMTMEACFGSHPNPKWRWRI
jgi:hypothetical protein